MWSKKAVRDLLSEMNLYDAMMKLDFTMIEDEELSSLFEKAERIAEQLSEIDFKISMCVLGEE